MLPSSPTAMHESAALHDNELSSLRGKDSLAVAMLVQRVPFQCAAIASPRPWEVPPAPTAMQLCIDVHCTL
jgi:hypothetical protein